MAENLFTMPTFGKTTSQPSVFNTQAPQQNFAWNQPQQPVYANQNVSGSGGYNIPSYDGSAGGSGAGDNSFSLGEYGQLAQAGVGAYLGAESLKLGKEQLGFAKDSFNVNLANQAQLINNEMESRQRARLETSGQYAPGQAQPGQASLQSDLQSYLKPRQVSGEAI